MSPEVRESLPMLILLGFAVTAVALFGVATLIANTG
jgi:hypothetical protein